jgi:hypothetical protein
MASAVSGNLVTNSYESIATTTLTTTTDYIEFTSIPSTYKHLQLRWLLRSSRAAGADSISVIFNSDTSSYPRHYLLGQGGGVTGAYGEDSTAGNTGMIVRPVSAASNTTGVFGAGVVDILDYGSTSKYKTVRSLCGYDNNGSGEITLNSGVWMSTSAITTLRVASGALGDLVQYSQIALYGIRG